MGEVSNMNGVMITVLPVGVWGGGIWVGRMCKLKGRVVCRSIDGYLNDVEC